MSFSVHNAVRFPADMTVDQVFAWMDPMRAAIRLAADQAFTAELLREAVCIHDRVFLRGRRQTDRDLAPPPATQEPSSSDDDRRGALQNARGMLLDDIRQAQRDHRRCSLDPEATLTVFRDTDGRLYGIVHAQMEVILKIVASSPDLEDFSYSNAADAPEDIEEEAWTARGDLWDRLLGPGGVPAERGAVFQLLSPDHFLLRFTMPSAGQVESMLQELPLGHARTARAIPRTLESAAWQDQERVLGTPLSSPSEWMRRYRVLSTGKDEAFNRLRDQMEALLPPITADRLLTAPEAIRNAEPPPVSSAPRP